MAAGHLTISKKTVPAASFTPTTMDQDDRA
jgi:hypothetical protein